MSSLRSLIKISAFALLLAVYAIVAMISVVLYGFSFERSRGALTKIISWTGFLGLKIIGIKVNAKDLALRDPEKNYLIVSNHLSYVDVLVISRYFPSCFVTSKEMKNTFFLGHICMLGGCLFVDRKNRRDIHKEVKELTGALNKGLDVTIFPEATSTNGETVIPFKRPLFQAALDANVEILPLCLNYKIVDGEKLSLKNRDRMFWHDDTPFIVHAFRLFSHKKMSVELIVLPPLLTRGEDKTILAEKSHSKIISEYSPVI